MVSVQGALRRDRATFQLAFADAAGLAGGSEVWLHGTRGTLHVDLRAQRVRYGGVGDAALRDAGELRDAAAGWNVEDDWVAAIRGERPVALTDFETGVHYMDFTDAVHESMAHGGAPVILK